MTSLERKNGLSQENVLRQEPFNFTALYNELNIQTLPRNNIKLFKTSISKYTFEECGVRKDICSELFDNKSEKGAIITITPLTLVITTFDSDKNLKNKKITSLGLRSNYKCSRSNLFTLENKQYTAKNIKTKARDCSTIVKAVRLTAIEQGLIKQ